LLFEVSKPLKATSGLALDHNGSVYSNAMKQFIGFGVVQLVNDE